MTQLYHILDVKAHTSFRVSFICWSTVHPIHTTNSLHECTTLCFYV